ncbi:MAG: hypothetical protein AABZ47_03285 [Planctomycetota bacterium]
MADQNLQLHVTQDGAAQTADAIGRITDEQKRLAEETLKSADATDEAKQKAQELITNYHLQQAAQRDVNQAVTQMSHALDLVFPGLGRLVTGLSRTTENMKTVATAGTGLGSVLKGLGSVAIIAGIGLIATALKSVEERARAAREEIDKLNNAANEAEKSRLARQQDIENVADQRRRIGGLSADASETAISDAETISQRFPALKREAVDEAAGTFSGLGLSIEQLVNAAILTQLGELKVEPGSSADSLRRSLESASTRKAGRIQAFAEREDTQSAALSDKASQSLTSTDAPTAALEEFIRRLPGDVAKNIDRQLLARVIQGLAVTEGQLIEPGDLLNPTIAKAVGRLIIDRTVDPFGSETEHTLNLKSAQLQTEGIQSTPNLVAIGEQILRELRKANDRPKTVNFHNVKMFGADARSQQRRITNGTVPTD